MYEITGKVRIGKTVLNHKSVADNKVDAKEIAIGLMNLNYRSVNYKEI